MLAGKRFRLNEKVLAETDAYFRAKIKILNDRYRKAKTEIAKLNVSILKETMLINKEELFLKMLIE